MGAPGPLDHDGLIAHIFTRDLAEALIAARQAGGQRLRASSPTWRSPGSWPITSRSAGWPPGISSTAGSAISASSATRTMPSRSAGRRASAASSSGRAAGSRAISPTTRCTRSRRASGGGTRTSGAGLPACPGRSACWPATTSRGSQLSEACRRAGLRVPDDVALLGVDDDDLLCEVARPSLSSVALPGERIGYEAARMLEALLSRPPGRARGSALLLPSPGVVTRRSSDVLAIDDEDVAAAVRFIREHAHEPIRVADVLGEVPVSRRSLERRFRRRWAAASARRSAASAWSGPGPCSPGPRCPSPEVARHAGFSDAAQLLDRVPPGDGTDPHRLPSAVPGPVLNPGAVGPPGRIPVAISKRFPQSGMAMASGRGAIEGLASLRGDRKRCVLCR